MTAADLAACREALARVKAAAEEAEERANGLHTGFSGVVTSATSWLLGNQSEVSGAIEEARKTRDAYDAMAARLERIALTGTHQDAFNFVQAAGGVANIAGIELAASDSDPVHLVTTVASDTAKDVGTVVKTGLPFVGLAVLGVGYLALTSMLGRRK